MIAALYVATGGPYFGIPGVDCWDEERDARNYDGPHPVIAHPPCARWSKLAPWIYSMSGQKVGDDGGCFAHALECVRKYGGVLEHPAFSYAWNEFGLLRPQTGGGWSRSLYDDGWVCQVSQGHYGHKAGKKTWLYAVDCDLPSLTWGDHGGGIDVLLLDKKDRILTPEPFKKILLTMVGGKKWLN